MTVISELVQQALQTGYLTIAAENKLRQLLSKPCQPEDLQAFFALQQAAMDGSVRQESRELLKSA